MTLWRQMGCSQKHLGWAIMLIRQTKISLRPHICILLNIKIQSCKGEDLTVRWRHIPCTTKMNSLKSLATSLICRQIYLIFLKLIVNMHKNNAKRDRKSVSKMLLRESKEYGPKWKPCSKRFMLPTNLVQKERMKLRLQTLKHLNPPLTLIR